jgi:hypothetical protein
MIVIAPHISNRDSALANFLLAIVEALHHRINRE